MIRFFQRNGFTWNKCLFRGGLSDLKTVFLLFCVGMLCVCGGEPSFALLARHRLRTPCTDDVAPDALSLILSLDLFGGIEQLSPGDFTTIEAYTRIGEQHIRETVLPNVSGLEVHTRGERLGDGVFFLVQVDRWQPSYPAGDADHASCIILDDLHTRAAFRHPSLDGVVSFSASVQSDRRRRFGFSDLDLRSELFSDDP